MTLLIVTVAIGGAVAIGLGWGWVVLTRHVQRPDVKTRIIKDAVEDGTADALARNLERTLRLQTLLAKVVPTHKNQLALAHHLLTQASVYDGLGRHGEALARTERAVAILERLPREDFVTYGARLAHASTCAAMRYSAVDDHENAIIAWRSTTELYGLLTAVDGEQFRLLLGTSLADLGHAYLQLDRDQEMADALENAVEVLERVVESEPDPGRHHLAWSLNYLAASYALLGRHEDALDRSQKALDLYLQLAAAPPETHDRDREREVLLLQSSLSQHLAHVGRHADAVQACQRAATTARQRVQLGKEMAERDLAVVLASLVRRHRDLGDHDKADSIQAEIDALTSERS